VEEHVDRPTREMIELLEAAPAERDMAPEGSRRFAELLAGQREWLLLDNEYWSQAVRDPDLRRRYAKRRRELRAALGKALAARARTLGAGPIRRRRLPRWPREAGKSASGARCSSHRQSRSLITDHSLPARLTERCRLTPIGATAPSWPLRSMRGSLGQTAAEATKRTRSP